MFLSGHLNCDINQDNFRTPYIHTVILHIQFIQIHKIFNHFYAK